MPRLGQTPPLYPFGTPNLEMCVQLYNNIYPFSPILSCVPIPDHLSNRPLSEHQESGQSDRSVLKCARQSDPGLLGHARVPVRLNQNRNNWMARAGVGRTELASQSEAARATRLFATEQSGINGVRLYSEAIQENRGNTGGVQGDILQHVLIGALSPATLLYHPA